MCRACWLLADGRAVQLGSACLKPCLESVLRDGPCFAGASFGLVDAVFAPAWRYLDTFDGLCELGVFTDTPRLRRWRHELSQRPSVRAAVAAD